jgi:hypothetical protein
MSSAPVLVETEDYTRGARNFQKGYQPRRLVRSAARVDALKLTEAGPDRAGQIRKDGPMYARLTHFKVDPCRLSELSAKIEELGPRAKALPGMIDVYAAWRPDGQGVVVALYENKGAADRAVTRIETLWGDLVNMLSSAPRTEVYAHAEHVTR